MMIFTGTSMNLPEQRSMSEAAQEQEYVDDIWKLDKVTVEV